MICGGKGTEEKNEEKPKAEEAAADAKPAEAEAAEGAKKEEVTYGEHSEEELRGIFDMMDDNGDGKIDASEVVKFMKTLGVDVELKVAEKMIGDIDDDGNGTIEFSELPQLFT